jgi:hypothetical protein
MEGEAMKEEEEGDPTHALVSSDDAIEWVRQMAENDPDLMTMRMLKAEPAAFGVGATIAKRTREYLAKQGVSESLVNYVFSQICYAGAMTIEIMRLGSAKLLEEYIAERDGEDGRE